MKIDFCLFKKDSVKKGRSGAGPQPQGTQWYCWQQKAWAFVVVGIGRQFVFVVTAEHAVRVVSVSSRNYCLGTDVMFVLVGIV